MSETHEQQVKRVLSKMVATGEVKTKMINGEVHYYIEKQADASPVSELQKLIDEGDVIKIFREGDVGFPVKYAHPTGISNFIESIDKFEGRKAELIRKFKALL
jgi:hypothetical protein